jgi:hypothetical protein
VIAAAALGSLTAACGSTASRGATIEAASSGPTTTFGPIAPPPAEVLDATVVFFDPDGTDRQPDLPPPGVIADLRALEGFEQRFVDGDPAPSSAARGALEQGKVLVGGTVSIGCLPAEGAQLAFTAAEVLLLPTGLPPDGPHVYCVRAITSVALLAIDATELPTGLRVRGT